VKEESNGMKEKGSLSEEKAGRDAALDLLERHRTEFIALGTVIAHKIVARKGTVTSTEVWNVLRERAQKDEALAAKLSTTDPRWMGAVFRAGKQWKRTGYVVDGASHGRPVSVWTSA
jgi:hypothetical protein